MPIPVTMKKNANVWFSDSEKPLVTSQEKTNYLYREMKIEQRSEKRLQVGEGVYSVIDSYAPQICKITDINSKGLSYVYFKGDEPTFESLTMDILVTGSGFCLERVPFKKVADNKAGDGQCKKRVACIEFVDLSDAQKEKIETFILNHVIKTVN